jgi:hypothetical protein
LISQLQPLHLALAVLASGVAFTVLWYVDHRTHLAIWRRDIGDGELRTHRMILYASWVLLGGLVLAAWAPGLALPLVIGAWLTRTLHEGLDEVKWHGRCSERETLVHLGMWISVHAGTAALFIWAFYFRYRGLGELPVIVWLGFGAVFVAMTWIGQRELVGYREEREARPA